jgi:hypothetical protein
LQAENGRSNESLAVRLQMENEKTINTVTSKNPGGKQYVS